MADDDFIKKCKAYQNESFEDFIRRYSSTQSELRDIIAYLIQHREQMRDAELEKLEAEAEQLTKKLADTKRKVLLEEIACFKDILALQRKLIEENDKPGDRGGDKEAGSR